MAKTQLAPKRLTLIKENAILLRKTLQLRAQKAKLQTEVKELQAENDRLTMENDQLKKLLNRPKRTGPKTEPFTPLDPAMGM